MPNSVQIQAKQVAIDIAMQQCGAADSIFDVAAANGIGITDALVSGQMANYPAVVNQHVADYFRKYGQFPASATSQLEVLLPGGIGFWAIGFDFIVQ
jgi:hypothetical protein